MKKIFFNVTACICAGLLFAGCNKEDDEDVNNSGGSGFDGVIKATAVNLPPGLTADEVDIDEVRVVFHSREDYNDEYVVRSGYDNGRFILNLPLIVQDKYLSTTAEGLSGNVKASDVNAKGCSVKSIEAYKGENEVGELVYYKADDEDPNAAAEVETIWYMYVDRDVNITGSTIDDHFIAKNVKYSLSLKRGWNKVYLKLEKTGTTSLETLRTEPSGLTWHLNNYRPK
ncbi:hypothetical protein AGMMS4957_16800 [Bacteroidia bacterium]|nr:hypothetical protein AGMMS4957_16800 [Bacteroidia bacterium]